MLLFNQFFSCLLYHSILQFFLSFFFFLVMSICMSTQFMYFQQRRRVDEGEMDRGYLLRVLRLYGWQTFHIITLKLYVFFFYILCYILCTAFFDYNIIHLLKNGLQFCFLFECDVNCAMEDNAFVYGKYLESRDLRYNI